MITTRDLQPGGYYAIFDYHYDNFIRDVAQYGVDGEVIICIGPYFVDE